MMDNMGDFRRVILSEVNKMGDSDKREIWRENEMKELSDLVQKRIHVLQNPQTCKMKQTLICNLTNPSGFASGIHDVLWCFVKAYHTNRTLVLISKHWHYAPDQWNSVFHPLSPVCDELKKTKKKSYLPGENDSNFRSLMGALPTDIAFRLMLAHGKPLAWWYGQFLKYILRPQEGLLKNVQTVRMSSYEHPIVGIHVRRTDKIGNEASFHPIEEYMLHVDDFYRRLALVKNVNVRRVFVATDDPKVLIECKKKYPNYVFVFNSEATATANNEKTRYSNSSLVGVVTDVFLLAHSDFLVCTLSSGLCRVAYELMQTLHPDASAMIRSLDVDHHYAWVLPPARVAVYKHVAHSKKEMALEAGDTIYKKNAYDVLDEALHKRSWDGYSIGTNSRTKLSAAFLTYKTIQQYPSVIDFPKYPDYNVSLPPFDFDNLASS
ncbi:alpha-(1,6)-fucosyltransferase-like [Limulus polyphemus]|uniref:Alpha-(1,6)-fucosyltransferase-like n=1 Tax=Limulus polyphemus TaxID=6850 RepID=A0ABM1T7Z3_LIMPO|nr:alpha-(1,6)-fucosyltransferase-like [Limulus polyphemus]